MPEGVSKRELGRLLGVSDAAVRKAIKAGRIRELSDGTVDPVDAKKRWEANTDPARTRGCEPANLGCEPAPSGSHRAPDAVRSVDDAVDAVQLIKRVLREEGVDASGDVDFGQARTAETILKARERDLKVAQRRKELVPLASVRRHVDKAFISYRQALQRLPSRFGAEMAAEIGCSPVALDKPLSRAIEIILNELSAPVVRD